MDEVSRALESGMGERGYVAEGSEETGESPETTEGWRRFLSDDGIEAESRLIIPQAGS